MREQPIQDQRIHPCYFLGQDHFNQRMWDLGYSDTRMRHRLSIRLTPEQNKYTNSFSFYINNTRLLDQRIDVNMYSQGHKFKRIKKLPQSLIESLNKFKASEVVKKSIGSKVVSQYIKLKKREIAEHNKVSDENKKNWERKNIIDC